MRTHLSVAFFFACVLPLAADAAWRNPVIWTATPAADKATQPETPTVDSLLARIAELESLLADARAEASAKAPVVVETRTIVVSSKPESSAPSAREIADKVGSAVMSVASPNGTFGGAVVGDGEALVSARAVVAKDSSGKTVGTASTTVWRLVGFDEARGVALVSVSGAGARQLGFASDVSAGAAVYAFGADDSTPVAGKVTQRGQGWIEFTADARSAGNGGAVVDAAGDLVGIVASSSCRVVEESERCLSYKVTANTVSDIFSKLSQGMRLFERLAGSSDIEKLVRGKLEGVSRGTTENVAIQYAVSNSTGKNSFDAFNARLADDQEGKITRLYLSKLKVAAENMYKAYDSLEDQAHGMNVFFIDHESAIEGLGDYQRATLSRVESRNQSMLTQYRERASFWAKKRNEYDKMLTDVAASSHDYLMQEGLFVEEEADRLTSERAAVLGLYSSETVRIF